MNGVADQLPEHFLYRVAARSPIARLGVRATVGIVIALGSAAAAARWGDALVGRMLPAMQSVLQDLMPEFRISGLEVHERLGQAQIVVQALLLQPLAIGQRLVHGTVVTTAHVTLGAFWQPVATAVATAAIWPGVLLRGFLPDSGAGRSRGSVLAPLLASALGAALAGCLATALSVALVPAMMAGLMVGQIYWHEANDQIVPHIVRLPRFLEEGGWLMLGLVVGAVVGMAVGAGCAVFRPLGPAKPDCGAP
jgi:hypothetical protein